ncbi:MAG: hypothetical protein KatS3mg060_1566 [Dehalococcoidia bacterium]|nr:MAG: hypothetical protein KatS3mg060_1566 [Dehalococcoidia bacterium]
MSVVVLFDVDNTLFDTERFRRALDHALTETVGSDRAAAFWAHYEAVRAAWGHVDLPEAIHRLTSDDPVIGEAARQCIKALPVSAFVASGAAAALAAAAAIGRPVIVSDGDPVFQRRKIEQSGLAAAVGGRVRIFQHKEAHTAEIIAEFPADHYWLVDDKLRILSTFKRVLGSRLTTVQVAYGAYAAALPQADDLPPDFVVSEVGDVAMLLSG